MEQKKKVIDALFAKARAEHLKAQQKYEELKRKKIPQKRRFNFDNLI